jgi:putative ABC transport system substrate-binding protein
VANQIARRHFIALVGGAAAAAPTATLAQQAAMPVVAFVNAGSAEGLSPRAVAFRKGLSEAGYIDGQNVTIEYHWLGGRNDRLPPLMAEIVRRQVAAIATPGSVVTTLAAKAATTTIPIVFGVPEDPVKLGLVTNLGRPDGNATGVNTFSQEVLGKRLRLLHDMVPTAFRVALLVNPNNASSAEAMLRQVPEAAQVMGLHIQIFNATTIKEIDGAFATLAHDHFEALFVAPDAFFNSRGVQFATLAARERIPTTFSSPEVVSVGGLMSYGADLADMSRQVGIYVGRILKGTRPADLPVLQSTKLELVINLQTARTLGIDVPPGVLSIADEVIE